MQAATSTVEYVKQCKDCKTMQPLRDFYFTERTNWRSSYCKPCSIKRAAKSEAVRKRRYPEKYKAQKVADARRWQKKNPEQWAKISRNNVLRFHYGLSNEDYDALVKAQGDKCGLCGSTEKNGRNQHGDWKVWSVDHCHMTGKIRGLLCFLCNTRLGAYEKLRDVVGLEAVERYLHGSKLGE